MSQVIPYIQVALGSSSVDGVTPNRWLTAAKACSVVRNYFFEQVAGFKQLMKILGLIEECVTVSPRLALFFQACQGAKTLMSAAESLTNLQGVFKPWHQFLYLES